MPETRQADRPVLRDVAARAGVSTSTASLAFAGDPRVVATTRERVLRAAEALGYAGPDPRARSLRRGRSGVVGVVVGDRVRDAFADPYAVAVMDGLAEAVGGRGAALLLLGGAEDEAHRLAVVEQVPLDAAVFVTCGAPDDAVVERLLRRRVPVVGVDGPRRAGVHLVDVDDAAASADVGALLAGLGHAAAAVVALPWARGAAAGPLTGARRAAPGHDETRLRLEGLAGALPVSAVWESASNLVPEGEAAARALLTGPGGALLPPERRPTAVVAQADVLAVGVVLQARALGLRVPQDLSVVGFDGIATPWLGEDRLTTVEQPAAEKGRAAARLVAELLAGGEPADVRFGTRLRTGTTTAAPPR